jgi:glycosyltransferase involved in cell wall biosynthesis
MVSVFDQAWPGSFRILVVTDGSDDGTPELVRLMGSPYVELIECEINRGKGAALRVGMMQSQAELVGQLDADLDLHPETLVTLVDILKRSELSAVVGSKSHPDSQVGYPFRRRILSKGYQLLVATLFGLSVTDTQTGAKVFVGSTLRKVLPEVTEQGFVFDLDLLKELHRHGCSIGEGPIQLDYQFDSSIRIGDAHKMLLETLRVWRKS